MSSVSSQQSAVSSQQSAVSSQQSAVSSQQSAVSSQQSAVSSQQSAVSLRRQCACRLNCKITTLILAVIALLVGATFIAFAFLQVFSFSSVFLITGFACLGIALILFLGVGCVQYCKRRPVIISKVDDGKKRLEKEKEEKSKQVRLKFFLKELKTNDIFSLNFSQIDRQDLLDIRDFATSIWMRTSVEEKRYWGEILTIISSESTRLFEEICRKKLSNSEEILKEVQKRFPTLSKLKVLSEDEPTRTKLDCFLEELKKELKKESKSPLVFSQITRQELLCIQNLADTISSETSERKKRCEGVLTQISNECRDLLPKIKELDKPEIILKELENFPTLSKLKVLSEDESIPTKLECFLEELKKESKSPLVFSQITKRELLYIQNLAATISSETSERKKRCGGVSFQIRDECRDLLPKIKESDKPEIILKELKCYKGLSELKAFMEMEDPDRKVLRRRKISVTSLQELKGKYIEELMKLRKERLEVCSELKTLCKVKDLDVKVLGLKEIEAFDEEKLKTLGLETLQELKDLEQEQVKLSNIVKKEQAEKVDEVDEELLKLRKELDELTKTKSKSLSSYFSKKKKKQKRQTIDDLRKRAFEYFVETKKENKKSQTEARMLYDEICRCQSTLFK
ncbi:hypothetical protein [Chlamydia sp. 17-3921]|uniref:hypothetical protein n=1 Tax=Chlamydia sp. 17-3921 TaxID=2675798 RepID=UPI001918E436|nr:hypothetical protein [Chlamydia sp. 17-3921]